MSWDVVLVDLAVVAAIGWVIWYFWLSEKQGVRAAAAAAGAQEVQVRVKGGYDPDVIVVESGRPVKIHFNRQETAACSEMVVFPDFGVSRELPAGEVVTVEIEPKQPGDYDFMCQMGMLRGKVVAE